MSKLFSALKIRGIEFKNRIFVSPMCQYSAKDGIPNDWHMVHLGSRAVGGAALVIAEATAVSPEGRISPGDLGLWNSDQLRAFQRITQFIKAEGSIAGVQLAHAGRKASTGIPWEGGKPLTVDDGGWMPWGPSAVPFDTGYTTPLEMSKEQIKKVVDNYVGSTKRALDAGFEVVELHFAHGYLVNEFLSPLSNNRKDDYGGTLENRMRFALEIARAVRAAWPAELPLFARISASEWVDGGWSIDDSVVLAGELKKLGVDLIDCSSGGNSPKQKINVGPGYQVPFAEAIREAGIATGAVGLITDANQAEEILVRSQADVVLLARELLRDPYWPLHAATALGVNLSWPKQYGRAKPRQ